MATRTWLGGTSTDPTVAANWSGAAVPVNDDTVIVPASTAVAIVGADQSAIDVAELIIEDGYEEDIGSRTTPWSLGRAAGADITWGGTGTAYLEIAGDNSGGDAFLRGSGTLYIASSGAEELIDDMYISSTSGTIYVGYKQGDAAEIDTIHITGAGTVYIGDAVTNTAADNGPAVYASAGTVYTRSKLATFSNRGATVTFSNCVAPTVTQESGTIYFTGAGGVAITAMTIYAGSVYYNSGDTITSLVIGNGGTVDFASNTRGCTVTAVEMYGAGVYRDTSGAVAVGTTLDLNYTALSTATVDVGPNRRITTGAVA